MSCDCCGKRHEIMYRTIDTRVYCLDCSTRLSRCCFGRPVVPSQWFRVPMSVMALDSLEARGYKREFEVTKPKFDWRHRHESKDTEGSLGGG